MTRDEIRAAAYADGYGDAVLEVGSGAPPLFIWDSRVERIADKATHLDGDAVMFTYYAAYDDGWMDGAHDEHSENRLDKQGKR